MTVFDRICNALLTNQTASIYDQTRAVLAAMREPTPEMIQAALDAAVDAACQYDPTPHVYWRAMIDAAATEPEA